MQENNSHTGFEKGFKESFADFAQAPDPAVWERIEAGLQRRRKIVFLARFAAAASLLLLFSITGWLIFRTGGPAEQASPVFVYEPEEPGLEPDTIEILKKEAEDIIIEGPPSRPSQLAQTIDPVKEKAVVPSVTEKQPELPHLTKPAEEIAIIPEPEILPLPEEVIPEAEPIEIAEESKPLLAEQQVPEPELLDLFFEAEEFTTIKPDERSWQLALGYGTIQGQSITDPSLTQERGSANFGHDPFSSKLATGTHQFSNIENTTHSQPITLGLLVNRNFSGAWGVETGLLFTRLKTTSTTNIINDEYTEYGSEILYLGIPASIRLNMISGRRLGMYISQGAVIEKGIRTRYYSDHFAFDVLKTSEEETYVADGVQISSLTAIGFDFRITKTISIYAQPGLQIFFLNQTQPYNIRSSSAIWPSLQTGLKFQL